MSFVARLRPVRLPRELVTLLARGQLARNPSVLASRPSLAPPYQTLRHARQLHQSLVRREEPAQENGGEEKATEFAQLQGIVTKTLLDTIHQDMNLRTMTPVQRNTIHEALKGVDVLAQAKTGTGKTLGFLLPVVQNILEADPSLLKKSSPRSSKQWGRNLRMGFSDTDTSAIIISPTRELAEQIAAVAETLTRRTGIRVQTAVGGTAKSMHLRMIKTEGCHLLVGTPGRLNDILSDQYGGIAAPKLKTLVLDEADRLLDQGFRPEIDAIKNLLPSTDRQNLMYSATIDKQVQSLARLIMKPDMHFVETVTEDEIPTQERVKQNLVVTAGSENQLLALFELIKQADANSPDDRPFKAIVYFNSSVEVQWAQDIAVRLKRSRRNDVMRTSLRFDYITSRRTQASRSEAANSFRQSKSAVLFSSDVTARGMDFPNVTHVIQVGLPVDRETYIHRLGRTARAGQEGEGWILVPENAGAEMVPDLLSGIPMETRTELSSATLDLTSYDPKVLQEPQASEPYGVQVNAVLRSIAQEFGAAEMRDQLKAMAGALSQNVYADQVRNSVLRMSDLQYGMTWREDLFPFLKQRRPKGLDRASMGGRGSIRGGVGRMSLQGVGSRRRGSGMDRGSDYGSMSGRRSARDRSFDRRGSFDGDGGRGGRSFDRR